MNDITKIAIIILLIIAMVILITIFQDKKQRASGEYEEESERDKMYRAIRYLVYLIIFAIIIPITIKVLFLIGILSKGSFI